MSNDDKEVKEILHSIKEELVHQRTNCLTTLQEQAKESNDRGKKWEGYAGKVGWAVFAAVLGIMLSNIIPHLMS